MKLEAKNDTEKRLLDYLEKNASDALREKIAALPEGGAYNLGAAFRHIQDEARKLLHSKSGFVDDETVFGWLIHYYEDVAPAEAAKPAPAKAKTKRTHKTEPAKAGVGKNRQPADGAGASKSVTKARGRANPAGDAGGHSEPPTTPQDGAGAPSSVASSTPPSGGRSSCVGRAAAVVSSPDSGALSPAAEQAAAAETTATAPESGFSLVLFESDEKGGAA